MYSISIGLTSLINSADQQYDIIFHISIHTFIFLNHKPSITGFHPQYTSGAWSHNKVTSGVYCAWLTPGHNITTNFYPASIPTHSILLAPDHTAKLPKSINCAWLKIHTGHVPTSNFAIKFVHPYTLIISIKTCLIIGFIHHESHYLHKSNITRKYYNHKV